MPSQNSTISENRGNIQSMNKGKIKRLRGTNCPNLVPQDWGVSLDAALLILKLGKQEQLVTLTFSDERKWREFVAISPALKKLLKEVL